MYDAKKFLDDDFVETQPKLPQLPPLVAKEALAEEPRSDGAIGRGNRDKKSPVSVSTEGSRRPRPPPLPQSVWVERNEAEEASGSLSERNYRYRSPFVGEEQLECEAVFYSTELVDDSASSIVKTGKIGCERYSTGAGESPIVIDYSNYGSGNGSPLELGKAGGGGRAHGGSHASQTLLRPIDASKGFNMPYKTAGRVSVPPIQLSHSKIISDSTFSDCISSYYSSNGYAFNGFLRNGSVCSVMGAKPLEHAPNISVPTQPLSIDLLDETRLYQCYSVYQLSDIYEWLLRIYFEWFNEFVLGKIEFIQLVQLLLEFQLPNTFDQDMIDKNVDRIIASLVRQGAVRFDSNSQNRQEFTIIIPGLNIQGVFTDLLPCYSFIHRRGGTASLKHNCYSQRCRRHFLKETRPEIKISEVINKSVGLWTDYWNLTEDDLSEINPKEVQRQSFIFDLIVLEERTLNIAHAAIEIYGARFHPALLPNDSNFHSLAFDIFHPLIGLHKEYLMVPLFMKLQNREKFIKDVGKIYLRWCSAAESIYIQYAESMAVVNEIISWEKRHKTRFAKWLKQMDETPEITRSKLYHDVIFMGGFFKSLQNLPVTLRSVLKCTDPSAEDYEFIELALAEIEKLSARVNNAHGVAIDHRKIIRFTRQLILGSNSNTVGYMNIDMDGKSLANEEKLNLKLTEKTRKLIKEGCVYKKRDLWLDPVPTYLMLLDNFILITEILRKGNEIKYKLVERPIPIDYLSLETKEDLQLPYKLKMTKESTLLHQDAYEASVEKHIQKTLGNSCIREQNVAKQNHKTPYQISTVNNAIDSLSYSFKVRNTATNDSITFLTSTADEREAWVAAIVSSFQTHAARDDYQVFKLRLLSDQFCYDELPAPTNLTIAPKGSVIDLAFNERYALDYGEHTPISADLYCHTKFIYEMQTFIICGSNNGIYASTTDGPSRWKLVLPTPKVTQLEINSHLNLLIVLSDKLLCYFSIPSLLAAYYGKKFTHNQNIGVLIEDKVSYFKLADDFGNSRQLFYERKGKICVLTPEIDSLTGTFKFFKRYKEYKISPAPSLTSLVIEDIVIFKASFIVCSSKNILLFNESFNDQGIPLPVILPDPDAANQGPHQGIPNNIFKAAIDFSSKKDSSNLKLTENAYRDICTNRARPITCFQLSNTDFVLIYDSAVVKLNNHGTMHDWKYDILVLDFCCMNACMNNEYLILVGENLVQIYDFNYTGNIMNNSLRNLKPVQIIKAKKLRLLNSQKFSNAVLLMSHPNILGRQALLEFYLAN